MPRLNGSDRKMTTPDILNFDELLAPIPGGSGAGVDLREDRGPTSSYDKIREARMAARDAERAAERGGDDATPTAVGAWRTIVDTAPGVLASQSKDLEIASMLTEGLLRLRGLAGLRDGFRLIRGLAENFWADLYPLPEDDDIQTRLASITSLNGEEPRGDGTLVRPLRRVEITRGGDPGPFTLAQYEQAQQLASMSDESRIQQRIAAGAVTTDMVIANGALTPRGFYEELLADLDACREEHRKLFETLDGLCGRDAPPSTTIAKLLEQMRGVITTLAPYLVAAAAPVEVEAPAAGAANRVSAAPVAADTISGRDDALNQLSRVADYFRRNEPQSTVSYVLDELVRRARLPLNLLIEELIEDENARRLFFVSAGIKPPERSP